MTEFSPVDVLTFSKLAKEFAENLEAIECTYDINMDDVIQAVVLSIEAEGLKMFFTRNGLNEITIYAESQKTGETCNVSFVDEVHTKMAIENYIGFKFSDELIKINTKLEEGKDESMIQSIKRIENVIYTVPYDDLTDYLKGIRDMVNLINSEEDNKSIANFIIEELNKIEL